jgi:hypothetical protein
MSKLDTADIGVFNVRISGCQGDEMSERDEALLFRCDEAACHADPMFYEIFTMDDRWSIIRVILDAAVQSGKLARTDAPDQVTINPLEHEQAK